MTLLNLLGSLVCVLSLLFWKAGPRESALLPAANLALNLLALWILNRHRNENAVIEVPLATTIIDPDSEDDVLLSKVFGLQGSAALIHLATSGLALVLLGKVLGR